MRGRLWLLSFGLVAFLTVGSLTDWVWSWFAPATTSLSADEPPIRVRK